MDNVIIAPFPPPLGGVGVAASNLREVLSQGAGSVQVFDTSSHAERENLAAAKGPRSYGKALYQLLQLSKLSLPLDRRRTVFHLFVTSDTAFFRDALFLLALRMQGKRVVIHLHSKTEGEFFLTPRWLLLFGRILSLADTVIVLSEHHRRFFSRYIRADKLMVLENFVLKQDFERGDSADASDLLYMSRLSRMKGIWELLEAMDTLANTREHRDFHLTIAGAADTPENEMKIRDFVREHGLDDVVTLAGLVRGRAKTELFRDSGVFLFPSRFENSPVTLKEAVQAGLPVIASDIDANTRILRRCGNSLTFPAGNAVALAETIRRLLDDPEQFAKLREQARSCRRYDDDYAREILAPFLA